MKKNNSKLTLFIVLLLLIPVLSYAISFGKHISKIIKAQNMPTTPTITPFIFKTYMPPTIKNKPVYKIMMGGI